MPKMKRQPTHPGNILKEDYLAPLEITSGSIFTILAGKVISKTLTAANRPRLS